MIIDFIRKYSQKIDIKLSRISNVWQLKCFKVDWGNNLGIRGRIYISKEKLRKETNKSKIIIGNDVIINSGWKYNLIGVGEKTILRTVDDGKIIIGNSVGLSNVCIVAFDEVYIDDYVTLGGGVKIYDTDFHSLNYDERVAIPSYYGINSKPIHIKKGAFIGAGVTILKGVTIGEKSIIGAYSVVAKDVPDGEVWGGNPCKFIKKV